MPAAPLRVAGGAEARPPSSTTHTHTHTSPPPPVVSRKSSTLSFDPLACCTSCFAVLLRPAGPRRPSPALSPSLSPRRPTPLPAAHGACALGEVRRRAGAEGGGGGVSCAGAHAFSPSLRGFYLFTAAHRAPPPPPPGGHLRHPRARGCARGVCCRFSFCPFPVPSDSPASASVPRPPPTRRCIAGSATHSCVSLFLRFSVFSCSKARRVVGAVTASA